ncbi:hypothetical protein JMG10_07715 [Nostoc ellipsosporum NOK]|nr:hypothetical protein [Nostoc ellipsosporum NOK]
MAKKFIDPNWRELRKLTGDMIAAWFYIWDNCDAAGVYTFDADYLHVDLKPHAPITIEMLATLPECRRIEDDKILITNFLLVNCGGELKEGYNPHKPVFKAIEKNGGEIFFDLGLKVVTGTKEEKVKSEFEAWFKLEKKIFKLIDTDKDKEEDKDEVGGVGEGEFKPVGIVGMIRQVFMNRFPNAFVTVNDLPTCRVIAENIASWLKLPGRIEHVETAARIEVRWGEMVDHIAEDSHLSKYSLTQILKHFSSIVQSYNNRGNNRKPDTKNAPIGNRKSAGAQQLLGDLQSDIRGQ